MKEHPILFSAPMVKAILEGRKTQTRRIVKPQPSAVEYWLHGEKSDKHKGVCILRDEKGSGWTISTRHFSPFYGLPAHQEIADGPMQSADRLWVKETFRDCSLDTSHRKQWEYRADESFIDRDLYPVKWKPSIFMPREASRITLEITGLRVEKLREISMGDVIAEGCFLSTSKTEPLDYQNLWESINGPGSWELNPWVWVIEFKRV